MKQIIILLSVLVLAACASEPNANDEVAALPPGDAERGAALFVETIEGAPACSTCHSLDGSALVGPTMQGYSQVAAARIEGVSADAYTYQSIARPAAHIVSGYSNAMYNQYASRLDPQQYADLIAYLLTL